MRPLAFSPILFARYALLMLTLMTAAPASAQDSEPQVKVAIIVAPPLVIREVDGTRTGYGIDLWNAVSAKLKLKTNYVTFSNQYALVDGMLAKRADIIAAPSIITSARDEVFDFSLPIMQAGLLIAVRDNGEPPSVSPLEDLLGLLFSKTMLVWLGIALVLILVPAHIVWLLDRKSENGVIENASYIPGIFEAMYWAVSGLTSQAQAMPHQWVARLFLVFWMFAGVVFVAFYTAQLTTTLTVRQIQGSIGGPDDLMGKQVAALSNTVAIDYLRSHNIPFQEFKLPGPMLQALQTKQVDAIVFNAPILLYYAAHEGKGLVRIVGPEFYVSPVAFGFQLDSPLRRKVNQALLALRDDGTYQRIYDKWFGVQ
jgi:polar amino acid transport system substrate-binding protein